MSPYELDSLVTASMVFLLAGYLASIVIFDLIKPSGMSNFGIFVICGVLLTAPTAYLIKNLYVLFATFYI